MSFQTQTNSVKTLKKTQNANLNNWPGIIIFLSTNRLPVERTLFHLCQLSNSSTSLKATFLEKNLKL